MARNNKKKEKLFDLWKMWAVIEKNIIVITRDKTRIIPLLTFPIIMMLVLGFTSGNTPKHISAAMVVYDNSPVSQMIQEKIGASQYFSIKYVFDTEDEAKKLLDKGKIRVIIELPPGLEEKFKAQVPVGVIVMVDESDSSVAMTSKQILGGIISELSNEITLERIEAYQDSLESAALSIEKYSIEGIDSYQPLDEVASAKGDMVLSKQIIDTYASVIRDSIPPPTVKAIPTGTFITFRNNTEKVEEEINGLIDSYGADSMKTTLSLLEGSSSLMQDSIDKLSDVSASLDEKKKNAMQRQQSYNENIAEPLQDIRVFARTRATSLIRPITYEEKSAYGTGMKAIDFLIPNLIALIIFQGAVMGMGRAVAGEKREGSLTRVFLTPTSNITIIFGTLLFYIFFEIIRASFIIIMSIMLFGIIIKGSLLSVLFIMVVYIASSAAIGMILSSLVKTEQQFMAMAMLVSLPTMFLSGAFFPLQAMPGFMRAIASFLPVTYAGDALRGVMVKGLPITMIGYPMMILFIFLVLSLIGTLTFFKRDIE